MAAVMRAIRTATMMKARMPPRTLIGFSGHVLYFTFEASLGRSVADVAMAMHTADGVVAPSAAADEFMDKIAMAAEAVVLEDLAVARLDHDRFVRRIRCCRDRPGAGVAW